MAKKKKLKRQGKGRKNAHKRMVEMKPRDVVKQQHENNEQTKVKCDCFYVSGGLKAMTLEQLAATRFPEREFIIEPWIRDGESVMLYAAAGLGKSMFAMSLALTVAGGGEFLGWNAPKARRVLYLDGEMHIQDIQQRALMLADALGEGTLDKAQAFKNMTIIARQYQEHGTSFPDLAQEEGRERFLELARQGTDGKPYDLIILDNLSTLATIEDENAPSAFNGVIPFLMQLKQAGIACMLVHHTGKGSNSSTYRGHSKMATTFEAMICMEKLDAAPEQYGTAFKMKWDKYRGERCDAMIERKAWLASTGDGKCRKWDYELLEDEKILRMCALLRSLQYVNQKELAVALGSNGTAISRLKRKAIADGYISNNDWINLFHQAKQLRDESEGQDMEETEF